MNFFLSCFLSLLPVWYGSNSSRKMSKIQLFVVGESLNSCEKLWWCKVVTQFSQPPYWALSAFTVFLLMLNWKKSFLMLGIKFRGHAKEEAKQQPATWMNFQTRKKITIKNYISFSHFVKPQPAINKAFYWCRDKKKKKKKNSGGCIWLWPTPSWNIWIGFRVLVKICTSK